MKAVLILNFLIPNLCFSDFLLEKYRTKTENTCIISLQFKCFKRF